jgi:hypothetical protein
MRCHEAKHWLLTNRVDQALPAALQRHLDRCHRCQRKYTRLNQLDAQVRGLPLPPSDPAVRAALWQRLEKQHAAAPVPAAPVPEATPLPTPLAKLATPRPSLHVLRLLRPALTYGGVAAGAAIVFVAGMFLGRSTETSPPSSPDPIVKYKVIEKQVPVPVEEPGDSELVVRLARHDVQLAAAIDPNEQLAELQQLAADLKEEALGRVKRGSTQNVPLLVDLYAAVAEQGIPRQAAKVAPEKKVIVVRELRGTVAEVQMVAKASLPVMAEMLEPLERAARVSADMVEKNRTPASNGSGAGGLMANGAGRQLLTRLVHNGLALADAKDPLQRAELSSKLAGELSPTMVLLSTEARGDYAGQLGKSLNDLLERGVAANLDQSEANDKTGTQKQKRDKVVEDSAKAGSVLKLNLEKVSPKAKQQLEQAIKGSGSCLPRVVQWGKEWKERDKREKPESRNKGRDGHEGKKQGKDKNKVGFEQGRGGQGSSRGKGSGGIRSGWKRSSADIVLPDNPHADLVAPGAAWLAHRGLVLRVGGPWTEEEAFFPTSRV